MPMVPTLFRLMGLTAGTWIFEGVPPIPSTGIYALASVATRRSSGKLRAGERSYGESWQEFQHGELARLIARRTSVGG